MEKNYGIDFFKVRKLSVFVISKKKIKKAYARK